PLACVALGPHVLARAVAPRLVRRRLAGLRALALRGLLLSVLLSAALRLGARLLTLLLGVLLSALLRLGTRLLALSLGSLRLAARARRGLGGRGRRALRLALRRAGVGVDGLPPAAAAVPLVPCAVLLPVHVAIVRGVDVVVLVVRRDLGVGSLVDRGALVAVGHRRLAPAVVDVLPVVVVVVRGLVHV